MPKLKLYNIQYFSLKSQHKYTTTIISPTSKKSYTLLLYSLYQTHDDDNNNIRLCVCVPLMPSTPNYIRFLILPFTLLDTSSSLFDCDTLLYSFHLAPLIPFGLKKQKRKKPIGIFATPLIPKPKLPNQFSQIAIKRTNGFLFFLSFFLHMTKCTDPWR